MNKKAILGSIFALALCSAFICGHNANNKLSAIVNITDAAPMTTQSHDKADKLTNDQTTNSKNNTKAKDGDHTKKITAKTNTREKNSVETNSTVSNKKNKKTKLHKYFFKTGVTKETGQEFKGRYYTGKELTEAKSKLIKLGFNDATKYDVIRILSLSQTHHWSLKHAAFEYYL